MRGRSQITVDTLSLRLPSEFAARANGIGRQIGKRLVDLSLSDSVAVDRLTVPVVRASAGDTDRVIANRIVRALNAQLNGPLPLARGTRHHD